MRAKIPFRPSIFAFVLVIQILSTILMLFFFGRLDNVVHADLYGYGLQFSYEWADKYWTYSRLMLDLLAVSIPMACTSIAFTFWQARSPKISSIRLITGVLLIIGAVVFACSLFFFDRLDNVVHADLYRYGLQFSYEWADKYWTYSRLIQGLLTVAIGMSSVSVLLLFVSAPTPEPKPLRIARVTIPKTCSLLTFAGTMLLALSIYLNSPMIAFVGLGLFFWGTVLFYIRPEESIKKSLFDNTVSQSLKNFSQILGELGYKTEGIYLPPKFLRGSESSMIYVSRKDMNSLPAEKPLGEEDVIFVKNPNGVLVTPPGIELKKHFERTLGKRFAEVNLGYLIRNMAILLVEDLKIAQELKMEAESDRILVTAKKSIFQDICKDVEKPSRVSFLLGCPLHSALACVLAEATGKPVVIEQVQVSEKDQTTKAEYHILEPKLEHT